MRDWLLGGKAMGVVALAGFEPMSPEAYVVAAIAGGGSVGKTFWS